MWVDRNVSGTTLFLSDDNSEYVDPYEKSVLVDDDKKNTLAWEDVGGIAIRHTSTPETEKQFLELLWSIPDLDPGEIYWK